MTVLQEHEEAQKAEQAAVGASWLGTGAVFATALDDWTHPDILKWREGKPWVWKGVPREHRAALQAAVQAGKKLPSVSPHDLRPTYATLALRRGVPVEVISKILGHARVSIMLDVYRHVLDNERRSTVVVLFDAVLAAPVGVPASLN